MTQEEKAKAYDEVLERAKGLVDFCSDNELKTLEYLFPELKEPEGERIRKAIYNALRYLETELSWDFLSNVDILDAYAWLEKQGDKKETICEQKPINDIKKPTDIKIHEGDKNNPYDMSFEEAQNYITKRDFDICRTDYPVFVDDKHILQTIGNVLKWADDNPKQELRFKDYMKGK